MQKRTRLRLARTTPLTALAVVGALTGVLAAGQAEARSPDRRGFQGELLLGGTGCMNSAEVKCSTSGEVAGKTRPHFGLGVTLGFRPIRFLMVGAAYNLGFFNPDYRRADSDIYRRAYQHGVFGVVRAILPIWRFDFGIEMGPGWSRQVFASIDSGSPRTLGELGDVRISREYSQGFALKLAPVVDFFITKHFFLGAKVDFLFNLHRRKVCYDVLGGPEGACYAAQGENQASVHQVIAGLHVGAAF